MNAPTLFVIAADLTKMQVVANIDESDVGRMRPGQTVGFRVDAYPTETFHGNVAQVRLQPTVVQNVVVYSTVIAVPNQQLKLKPGMTANVNIEIARRNEALRVPAAAVRFRPTEAMFQVLNQEVPPEVLRGAGGSRIRRPARRRQRTAGRAWRTTRWTAWGRDPGNSSGGGAPAAKPTPSAAATPAPAQQAQAAPQAGGGRPPSAEARGGGDQPNAAPGGGRGVGGGGGGAAGSTPT